MNTTALASLQILVVEDSPTQAIMLKESLEGHHLRVKLAEDGLEALQLLQLYRADIIISDIEMPRMNGYEFCRLVKQDPKLMRTPVILLTNLTDVMDAIKGIECGADSFITKPCDIDFLISTICDIISTRENPSEENNKEISLYFGGQRHMLHVDKTRVTDMLLSTFAAAIQKNRELESAYRKLNLMLEELERKKMELEQLNKEKNQFLGMAAHDLRNPLTVIQGYSNLLREYLEKAEKSDDNSSKMIERISTTSSFMLQIINDLLDVSVIESGTVNLHLSKINLNSLIDEALLLVSQIARDKKITLHKKCPGQFPDMTCDHDKVLLLLTNLLTNALKFSHPGSHVEIGLELSNDGYQIKVQDHGVGIPQEEKDRLFKPFTKTTAKSTAGESSTGLGLAIVKKVVQAHSGKVWVESELGKGTTFFVFLPLAIPLHELERIFS